jgi:hypothetical protein
MTMDIQSPKPEDRLPDALVMPGYADLPITATRVRVPLGVEFFRYPRVYVDVTIGPLAVAFTVITRKGRRTAIISPASSDGVPAIGMPSDLLGGVHAVVLAAVSASPKAVALLDSKRPRKRQAA